MVKVSSILCGNGVVTLSVLQWYLKCAVYCVVKVSSILCGNGVVVAWSEILKRHIRVTGIFTDKKKYQRHCCLVRNSQKPYKSNKRRDFVVFFFFVFSPYFWLEILKSHMKVAGIFADNKIKKIKKIKSLAYLLTTKYIC